MDKKGRFTHKLFETDDTAVRLVEVSGIGTRVNSGVTPYRLEVIDGVGSIIVKPLRGKTPEETMHREVVPGDVIDVPPHSTFRESGTKLIILSTQYLLSERVLLNRAS